VELAEQDAEMLAYAVKLTRHPARVSSGDVERLRGVGFDDTGILDICQVTAYYNYVNRLADGLGVELEDFWEGKQLTMDRVRFEQAAARRRVAREAEA